MLFRHTKRRISSYSSPVILISRKVTQDKRVVMDFRHLNTVKNNLAYPLLEIHSQFTTALSVGWGGGEVLSVLDLKDMFHSLRLLEDSKDIVEYCHTSEVPHICTKECLWD